MNRAIALIVGVLCAVSVAGADEVVFKNGDRVTGKIDTYDGTKLVMKSGGSKVEIELKNVKTFSTDGPIDVVLKDGTVIHRRVILGADGNVTMVDPAAAPTT